MNKNIYIQSWKLEIISKLLWKSKKALQQKLWRDKKTIDDLDYIKQLIK